jgi:hypothetical protein
MAFFAPTPTSASPSPPRARFSCDPLQAALTTLMITSLVALIRSASGAIVAVSCCEETLDVIQHETVVIRLGEGGSLFADVAGLFGGCRDCSGQNNLSVG